ncbi:CAP domain-containing protein [Halteromyces radiatus]|uniref:CAP domain-containing protein n=1 Tax=Halteromyces radiatus TaxID=101107 RepID=UPI00221F3736|nr:CAP domain-containing protein [Halteromyces radiatus]KAI8084975.1 CAP domain-containing protein [Halteromyces radiatus]
MLSRFFVYVVAFAMMLQLAYALSKKDINSIVNTHNKFRKIHSAPALKWDKKLAQYAQNWSNKCVFQHSGGPYGENLAMGYGSLNAAIQAWYDEGKSYNYNNPGFSSSTGHFTQVVWKGTTKIGCGLGKCNGRNILTCSYKAPGNMLGDFPNNVLPPK